MKVAYVLNSYPQPSQSFVRREIRALERQGVEVVRLAMRPGTAALVDPGDIEEAQRCHYVLRAGAARLLSALLRRLARAPRGTLGALWQAVQMARARGEGLRGWLRHGVYLCEGAYVAERALDRGCTHLHAHFGTNATAVALLAAAMGGPGYSFTTHGPEEFDAPVALSLGRKVARARFAVAISAFGRSQLFRWAPFEAWARIEVVHCGIEPEAFDDPLPARPEDTAELRLVAIGRFVEQKGQMLLIDALGLARDRGVRVLLHLVGDGEMRAPLEAEIARLDLGKQVRLTGWLSEAEVRAQLAWADALVMPSFAEGLPMVVMEAMAAERPVLATFIAGTPELVVAGETGWLVPAGDSAALAQAMIDCAHTGAVQRAEMGRAARERVLQRHDIDQEAARLAALFERASRMQG